MTVKKHASAEDTQPTLKAAAGTASVKDVKKVEPKRFNINVDSGLDEAGNKIIFSFTGPEKASLGLIYDAAHRILLEILSILKKRAEDLAPKKPEEVNKSEDKDIIVKKDK